MKKLVQEIIYVIKTLDRSTHKRLIAMVIGTIVLCVLIVTKIENPVITRWQEDRATEQAFKERQKEREQQFSLEEELESEELKSDKHESGKEPVY